MTPRLYKIYRVLLSIIELYQAYQVFTFTICLKKKVSKLIPSFINVYQAQKGIVIMFYLSFGSNQQDLPSLKKQSPTKFKTFAMLFLSKKIQPSFEFYQVSRIFEQVFTKLYQHTYKGARSAAIFFHQALPPKTKFQTISTKFFQASQVLIKFYHQTNAREARQKILPSFTKFHPV